MGLEKIANDARLRFHAESYWGASKDFGDVNWNEGRRFICLWHMNFFIVLC